MGELIDGLLALAKSANEPVVRVPVDLTALAQRMARECLERNTEKHVVFHIQDDMTVRADGLLMSVVLNNLIGNACKFSAKTPEAVIEVGCHADKSGQAVYFVKDNGAGFDEAYADKLFGIFQRLHNANDYEGTGIGLANVKQVIERHGGTVWAKGQVGAGATFYFTLG
jgi:light-regulated signal transduction histidine kinase (bacteriophytochrome)